MSMRIRVGRSSTMNAKGGKILGIFLILFGLTFALSSISMSCRATMFKKMLPGNVQEYDAYITEVLSVESEVIGKRESNGQYNKFTVYNSEVVLEYDIYGKTYITTYTIEESKKAYEIGDKCRLNIDPENPTKIYGYSTGEGEAVLMAVEIISGLIGGAVILAGIILIVKDKKRANAEKEQTAKRNQGYPGYQGMSGNQGMPGYQDSSDYLGYNGQNLGSQGYNGQDFNGQCFVGQGYDASSSQGTNYSGTSLRD